MKVEKLDHFHAYAKDVDAVARLFADLFGKESVTWEHDQLGARGCFVPSLQVEFLQPTDPNGEIARVIGTREEGMLCVNFKVPNIEEAIAEMESRGIKLIRLFQIGQVKQAWFESKNTFGVQIELGEYPGDDIAAAAVMPGPQQVVVR